MENAKINALAVGSTANYGTKKAEDNVTNPISACKRDYNDSELLNTLDALALMNRPLVIQRYAA